MKKCIIAAAALWLASGSAWAVCHYAPGQNVPPDLKRTLDAKCAKADKARGCDKQATAKKLYGKNRERFLDSCTGVTPNPRDVDPRAR